MKQLVIFLILIVTIIALIKYDINKNQCIDITMRGKELCE